MEKVRLPSRLCQNARTHRDTLLNEYFIPNYKAMAASIALNCAYCVSSRYDCEVPFDCACKLKKIDSFAPKIVIKKEDQVYVDPLEIPHLEDHVHPLHGLQCGIGGIHEVLPEPDQKEKVFVKISDYTLVDQDADPFLVIIFIIIIASALFNSFS